MEISLYGDFLNIVDVFGRKEFVEWLGRSSHLKTFWIKPIIRYRWLSPYILSVDWKSRRSKGAIYIFSAYSEIIRKDGYDTIIIGQDIPCLDYDAESILAYWEIPAIGLLKPNWDVEIRILDSDEAGGYSEYIQRRSWGFYIPPCGFHLVFVAFLNNKPVGSAYLNPVSHNIDFGVHVVRKFWRRRIGTRILWEIIKYAEENRWKYITVVRVYRKPRGTSGDKRATSFYISNRPSYIWRIYRLR